MYYSAEHPEAGPGKAGVGPTGVSGIEKESRVGVAAQKERHGIFFHYARPRAGRNRAAKVTFEMEGKLQGGNIVATQVEAVDEAGYMAMNVTGGKVASPQHSMQRQQSATSANSQTLLTGGAAVLPDSDGRYLLEPTARLASAQRARAASLKVDLGKKCGEFESPQYMNAPLADEQEVVYEEDLTDLLAKNDMPSQSENPTYSQAGQCDLSTANLPPPPPAVTEDFQDTPTYAPITKPDTPTTKRPGSTKSAESVLYPRFTATHKSLSRKSYDDSTLPAHSRNSPEHAALLKDNGSFVRTLLCLLFVLFLMCACSLAVSVYLLLNWPSDPKSTCKCSGDLSEGNFHSVCLDASITLMSLLDYFSTL